MRCFFHLLILILIVLINQTCTTWKLNLNQVNRNHAAIENAVLDFYKTSSLAKKNNTFSVYAKELNSDVLGVSIMGTINKLIVTEDNKSSQIPTRYIEYEGKLFYWYDENYSLNDTTIDKLNQYKLIDSIPSFSFAELINDDTKKGMNYFFCKQNLKNYKKIKTTKTLEAYSFSKLNCK